MPELKVYLVGYSDGNFRQNGQSRNHAMVGTECILLVKSFLPEGERVKMIKLNATLVLSDQSSPKSVFAESWSVMKKKEEAVWKLN